MWIDVCYGVCAGVVPIIIPYTQTFKDKVLSILGKEFNVGIMLSILGVTFSLMGTVLHVYDKAKKLKEFAGRNTAIEEGVSIEFEELLARCGAYDDAGKSDDRDAFKTFVRKSCDIKRDNRR